MDRRVESKGRQTGQKDRLKDRTERSDSQRTDREGEREPTEDREMDGWPCLPIHDYNTQCCIMMDSFISHYRIIVANQAI